MITLLAHREPIVTSKGNLFTILEVSTSNPDSEYMLILDNVGTYAIQTLNILHDMFLLIRI